MNQKTKTIKKKSFLITGPATLDTDIFFKKRLIVFMDDHLHGKSLKKVYSSLKQAMKVKLKERN
jgi:hypothetical protein